MVSQKLKLAIILSPKRAYKIAQEAGLHPSTLSKLLNGIERAKPSDSRILKVGRVLGVPAEDCFENNGDNY